ncbi:hypothetical protein GCM10007108_11890 [Thermogymnomonas acidicola]|uniref:Transcription elongation factor Spt4 n=1 Tax=Thermogymnomonas acidicola TaxID=399579 RepID=A0AA37BRQ0_9ARCH|nr:transcription elongation factor subunit Spt4 [Thermogymnomonas acidicola]GGM75576.1 hypothetical protein GCM10007108_11890 [Thermogymnomonas acidicola]
MAKAEYRACRKCKRLTTDEVCSVHPEEKTTNEWAGFVIIEDPEHSVIAEAGGYREKGRYAIKVRQ